MTKTPPPQSREPTVGPSSPTTTLSRRTSVSYDDEMEYLRSEEMEDGPRRGTKRKPLSLNEHDESVMIAVRALDDMRSRAGPRSSPTYHYASSSQPTPPLSVGSTATSPSLASQALVPENTTESYQNDFVSRVSGIPLVNTALKAYEQSKASSRVMKYGAGMVESSMKAISKPVINRLPVNQLDEFACRQLDRFGSYARRPSASPRRRERSEDTEPSRRERWRSPTIASSREISPSPSDHSPRGSDSRNDTRRPREQQALLHRGIQNILVEAGGIGAAVSEESMRRLQYCLHWLQYATGNIDAQILVLRNFIASIHGQDGTGDEQIAETHLQTLTEVKRNVVDTIRQVVDVVSKYAGGALPEPARARVRQFILHLPQRWANSAALQGQSPGEAANPPQTRTAEQPLGSSKKRRMTSDSSSSTPVALSTHNLEPPGRERGEQTSDSVVSASTNTGQIERPTTGAVNQAAQRILTLATESLDMMRSVTSVFRESLDRADAWVERLRIVGIQRQTTGELRNGERRHSNDENNEIAEPGDRWNIPSPSGATANSFDALSLSSKTGTSDYATPRSTLSSLPTPTAGEFSGKWDYTYSEGSRRGHAHGPAHSRSQSGCSSRKGADSDVECDEEVEGGREEETRSGSKRVSGPDISNLRGTPHAGGSGSSVSSSPRMDVDG